MADYQTCRFCKEGGFSGMVKYGVRHYAHFKCYLEAGKRLADLHDWQIIEFPALLLHKKGLLGEAQAAQDRVDARQSK